MNIYTMKKIRIISLIVLVIAVILGNFLGTRKTIDDYKYFNKNKSEGGGYYIKAEKLIRFGYLANYEKNTGKLHAVLEEYYVYVDDKGSYGVVCLGDITNDHYEDSVLALESYSRNPDTSPKAEPIYVYGYAERLTDEIKSNYSDELEGIDVESLGQMYLNGRITPNKTPWLIFPILVLVSSLTFVISCFIIRKLKKNIQY